MPKLMWLFIFPFLASILTSLLPAKSGKKLKYFAIVMSLIPLFMLLFFGLNQWVGDEVHYAWFPFLSIEFYLRIDSLSLLFLGLTAVIIPITLLAVRHEAIAHPHVFYGLILLLQGLLIGFFTSRDLVVFVIFWEAMLFPLYFLITLWGKEQRRAAALKFLIYMIAGSSLLVAAVLALFLTTGTFNLDQLITQASGSPYAPFVCAIFVLAFAVKTPLFPFHGWLPSVYYQASTSGSILLSALLSKAGIYGFLRIGFSLFPDLIQQWSPLLLGLSITGVLYGGLAAWAQSDYKRLIAYSSFSHVNFILAGVFVWSQAAHEGAILQAINHGITIAGLFIVAGWLEERLDSTSMGPFRGIAQFFPRLCWITLIFVLSSIALPGTNNFIGEFLILFGLFTEHPWLTCVLGLSVILSVVYMLRWMQQIYFGNPKGAFRENVHDIQAKELWIALPLVALIFWIGIYPAPILREVVPAAGQMMTHTIEGVRQ